MFRNNEDHVGKIVYFRGEVIQVIEDEPGFLEDLFGEDDAAAPRFHLRVNVTKSRYGYEDTVFLFYSGERLLEDDVVDFVGRVRPLLTYEAIFGQKITIPAIEVIEARLISTIRSEADGGDETQARNDTPTEMPSSAPAIPTPTTEGSVESGGTGVATSPQTESAAPTPTPGMIGFTRENPAPVGSNVIGLTEHVRVIEYVRGADAYARVRREYADWPVSRPDPGFEYVVVGIRVANGNNAVDEELSALGSFGLTGTSSVLHGPAEAVMNLPISWGVHAATLPPGTSEDLWIAYLVPVSEERLMLRFGAGGPFDTRFIYPSPLLEPRFIALDEDAGVADPEIEPSPRSQGGRSAADPVAIGDTIAPGLFEIRVVEVRYGASASAVVLDGWPAPGGREFVAARVHVRRVGGGPHFEPFGGFLSRFLAASSEGVIWEGSQTSNVVVEDGLDARMYVGGESEGWVVVEAVENTAGVLLVYEDHTGVRWYLALE